MTGKPFAQVTTPILGLKGDPVMKGKDGKDVKGKDGKEMEGKDGKQMVDGMTANGSITRRRDLPKQVPSF